MTGEHDPGGIALAALRKPSLIAYPTQQQIKDGDDSQAERTQSPYQKPGSTNRCFIKEHPPRSHLMDGDRGPPQPDDYRRNDPPFPIPSSEKPDERQDRTDNPQWRGIIGINAFSTHPPCKGQYHCRQNGENSPNPKRPENRDAPRYNLFIPTFVFPV